MLYIDPAPLERTITRLITQLETASSETDDLLPDAYEKLARAINGQMKALHEIYGHNQRRAAQEKQRDYLNYDELPPPSPEQREQFIERLMHLYNRLNGAEPIQADGGESIGG